MNLEQHKKREDMKVWLSIDELDELIETTPDTEHRLMFELGGRCGLRSHEILDVSPSDVVNTDAGWMLRVWHGKGDKFRETPMPPELAIRIQSIDDVREAKSSAPIISTNSTRTLRRWTARGAQRMRERTGDEGWSHLSTHDLRRTWAGQLRAADVDALVVLPWGGWNDLETFLDHYKGEDTPETKRREREKVDWL